MDSRLARLDLHTALVSLADLVMPRECVVCGDALLPDERDICMCCAADLPLTHFETVSRNPMADRYNERIAGEQPEPYQYATALFFYEQETGYDNITRALKYSRNVSVGRHFASMLGRTLAVSPFFADVDMVVPVPLHWTRHLSRGYNQAEIIAREVTRQLANPSPIDPSLASNRLISSLDSGQLRTSTVSALDDCDQNPNTGGLDRNDSSIRNVRFEPNLLIRQRRTASQTTIGSPEGKAGNMSGAFRVNKRKAARLGGVRHILLVDDVFTSGSTLGECHRALREILPSEVRISAATLGFTGSL